MGSSGSKLSDEDIEEIEKNTPINKSGAKKVYKLFKKSVPSEEMGVHDYMNFHRAPLNSWGSGDDYNRICFSAFNGSGFGYLSFKDYLIAYCRLTIGPPEERIKMTFKAYDPKGNGKLTYDDILKVQKAMDAKLGPMYQLSDRMKLETRCKRIFSILEKDPAVDTIDLDELREVSKIEECVFLNYFDQ